MRRKEKEVVDEDEINSIIERCQFCRIGLCDGNTPYIIPVCFGFRQGSLFFHSAAEGLKIDMIRNNPDVCFQMDCDTEIVKSQDPCKWSVKYSSLIGYGIAYILTDLSDKIDALSLIMEKYSGNKSNFNFSEKSISEVCVIRVTIESITVKKSG